MPVTTEGRAMTRRRVRSMMLAAATLVALVVVGHASPTWAIRAKVPPEGSGAGRPLVTPPADPANPLGGPRPALPVVPPPVDAGSGAGSAVDAGGGAAADQPPTDRAAVAPIATLPVPPPAPATDAAALRAECTELLLANRAAADEIFATVNAEQARQLVDARAESHQRAAKAIAKNERHVIMAYAAMWILAVGFVVLLWLRQARLRRQIEALRGELERATKA